MADEPGKPGLLGRLGRLFNSNKQDATTSAVDNKTAKSDGAFQRFWPLTKPVVNVDPNNARIQDVANVSNDNIKYYVDYYLNTKSAIQNKQFVTLDQLKLFAKIIEHKTFDVEKTSNSTDVAYLNNIRRSIYRFQNSPRTFDPELLKPFTIATDNEKVRDVHADVVLWHSGLIKHYSEHCHRSDNERTMRVHEKHVPSVMNVKNVHDVDAWRMVWNTELNDLNNNPTDEEVFRVAELKRYVAAPPDGLNVLFHIVKSTVSEHVDNTDVTDAISVAKLISEHLTSIMNSWTNVWNSTDANKKRFLVLALVQLFVWVGR